MKNNIINELKFASKKKKNAVLGYVYCDYLLDMFEEIERLNNENKKLKFEYVDGVKDGEKHIKSLLDYTIKAKDKEIERLKAREKECIEHYQVALKYANEMEERTIKAMHFIDQVLSYHLSSGYEQLDKDCNELYGILRGVDKEC